MASLSWTSTRIYRTKTSTLKGRKRRCRKLAARPPQRARGGSFAEERWRDRLNYERCQYCVAVFTRPSDTDLLLSRILLRQRLVDRLHGQPALVPSYISQKYSFPQSPVIYAWPNWKTAQTTRMATAKIVPNKTTLLISRQADPLLLRDHRVRNSIRPEHGVPSSACRRKRMGKTRISNRPSRAAALDDGSGAFGNGNKSQVGR
jgi:hypothetical protein